MEINLGKEEIETKAENFKQLEEKELIQDIILVDDPSVVKEEIVQTKEITEPNKNVERTPYLFRVSLVTNASSSSSSSSSSNNLYDSELNGSSSQLDIDERESRVLVADEKNETSIVLENDEKEISVVGPILDSESELNHINNIQVEVVSELIVSPQPEQLPIQIRKIQYK